MLFYWRKNTHFTKRSTFAIFRYNCKNLFCFVKCWKVTFVRKYNFATQVQKNDLKMIFFQKSNQEEKDFSIFFGWNWFFQQKRKSVKINPQIWQSVTIHTNKKWKRFRFIFFILLKLLIYLKSVKMYKCVTTKWSFTSYKPTLL